MAPFASPLSRLLLPLLVLLRRCSSLRQPVAVCATGPAGDWELTGPSFMTRVLTSYPDTHLFVSAPLDESTFKLHGLAWAPHHVAVSAFSVFRKAGAFEGRVGRGALLLPDPKRPIPTLGAGGGVAGLQLPLLLELYAVERCLPLVRDYERRRRFRFRWIVHARLDSFWFKPLPPLSDLPRDAYTVPGGGSGVSDRFGVGTWRTALPALSRLSVLPYISLRREASRQLLAASDLSTEVAFGLHMNFTNTPVARRDFWFCIFTRERLEKEPVAALTSASPLNGARCQPCVPSWRGEEAERMVMKLKLSGQVEGGGSGVEFCDGDKEWPDDWDQLFDKQTGPILAEQRMNIVGATFEECVLKFEQLKNRTEQWGALSPRALCLRRAFRTVRILGGHGESFGTLTPFRDPQADFVVLVQSPADLSHGLVRHIAFSLSPWLEALYDRYGKDNVVVRDLTKRGQSAQGSGSSDREGDVAVLSLPARAVTGVLATWLRSGLAPRTCQLLVAFLPQVNEFRSLQAFVKDASKILSSLSFELDSCIRESRRTPERCTYFSTTHCTSHL